MDHVGAVEPLALHDVRLLPDHLLGRNDQDAHAEDVVLGRAREPLVVDRRHTVPAAPDEVDEQVVLERLAEPVRSGHLGPRLVRRTLDRHMIDRQALHRCGLCGRLVIVDRVFTVRAFTAM